MSADIELPKKNSMGQNLGDFGLSEGESVDSKALSEQSERIFAINSNDEELCDPLNKVKPIFIFCNANAMYYQ